MVKSVFFRLLLLLLLLLSLLALIGCAAQTTKDQPSENETALTITGLVAQPQSWTLAQIKDLDKAYARALCADSGQERDFSGPLLGALLEAARPKAEAKQVVFLGEYEVTGEAALADLPADGIVAITGSGKLRVILPGLPGTAQVTGLYQIEIR